MTQWNRTPQHKGCEIPRKKTGRAKGRAWGKQCILGICPYCFLTRSVGLQVQLYRTLLLCNTQEVLVTVSVKVIGWVLWCVLVMPSLRHDKVGDRELEGWATQGDPEQVELRLLITYQYNLANTLFTILLLTQSQAYLAFIKAVTMPVGCL